MIRTCRTPVWQRALIVLSGAFVGLVVVIGLQWGRPVLIPIALAILLTFLLNPIVRTLERRGLERLLAVLLAVSAAGFLLMGLGWIMTRQVGTLLAELPRNTANIKAKVKTLRELGSGPFADQFTHMVDEISQELQRPSHPSSSASDLESNLAPRSPAEVTPFRAESTFWLHLTGYLGSAFEVFATLAFSLVLLVFFLLGRDDFRDRVVLLAGKTRLALTSKALEDVTDRISRYVVLVATVNGGFGILLATGLFVLQVPYALLWGFLAAGLRFVPYIGTWIGAVFPILMSLATFEGWWQPLAVIGYVMVLELTSNNLIEPFLFGHSIGVSPTALLISAAFWMFLWGPIGLVLSAPFAVCLVVLGKNIPQLRFLNLLLGDIPALEADVGIYQRLMLGDEHQAVRLVLQRRKDCPLDDVYDDMLIPALNYMKRDLQRDYLTDDDRQTILKGVRASLSEIDQLLLVTAPVPANLEEEILHKSHEIVSDLAARTVILGCPSMDDTDTAALEMRRQSINPAHGNFRAMAIELSMSELLFNIAQNPPDIVCIVSLPPGGLTHATYTCKRLREVSAKMQIIVGRWGPNARNKIERDRLQRAGATFVTTTVRETCKILETDYGLKPVLPPVSPLLT